MLYVIYISIVTRPFRLVRDLQHTNRSSPAEGAGKGSSLPLSHVDGPLCIIHVNCNSSKLQRKFQSSPVTPLLHCI